MEFMKKALVLYSHPTCPFAHRAHMTLLEKGLEFDYKLIPLSSELQRIESKGVSSAFAWKDSGLSYQDLLKIKTDYKATINPTG